MQTLRSTSSASVDLVEVDPARVAEFWPIAEPWLKAAYDRGHSDDSLEDVRNMVFAGRALLWLVHEDFKVLGAVVTQVSNTTNRRLCTVLAFGGTGFREWTHLLAKIEDYGRTMRCDAMRIYGRPGFARVYPEYKQPWIALERSL